LKDLNNIELPSSVVAALYRSVLIESTELQAKPQPVSAVPAKESIPGWKSLGDNRKNILIIVNSPGDLHLPDPELNFLATMLGACKLNLRDVAIVNLNNHPNATYRELTGHFKSNPVFLFGVEPSALGLPMSFPHFQLQNFTNCSFLFTPSLKDLENDKVLKSKLWVCLKKLFSV